MTGYSVKIAESSRELTAKEKIKLKDTGDAIKLDEATVEGALIIKPTGYVVLDVHNEKSDNVDYKNYIIEADNGNKYVTGSESFWSSFKDIFDEMEDAGETDYEIKCYRLESKNYKGKFFLTCSIV